MSAELPGFLASAAIYPSRFVYHTAGSRGYCEQATASTPIIGVSQEGTQEAPGTAADSGYAATAGRQVKVYGPGKVALLKCGGTVSAGNRLTADASGQGVAFAASTALQYIGGIALSNGVDGAFIPVLVMPFDAVTA
jgi:hypothetical protein